MKRLFALLLIVACTGVTVRAQDEEKLADEQRVALTAVVEADGIPATAQKQLINKMNQIAAKNGCAATANSRFVITCTVDELTKDITATVPAMHAYTLGVTFFVGDGVEGRLFSSTTIEAKGVGQTPDKAYISALKNVKVGDPAIKAMVDKGKQEIIAYYNANCDLIITEAKAMVQRQEFTEALASLTGIPNVCRECYEKALEESVTTYQAWRDATCEHTLQQAKACWAARDAKAASEALAEVPADGACVEQAKSLEREIAAKLDAKERQEWDFKMQQYEDRIAAQQAKREEQKNNGMSQQEIIRTAAVAAISTAQAEQAQPAAPKYQIKGKWFK